MSIKCSGMECICECFTEITKAMKLYSFPKYYNRDKNKCQKQSEMEHVKDYKIAENLSKQNKVSAFHVSTFKRLRRSTSLYSCPSLSAFTFRCKSFLIDASGKIQSSF